MTRIDAGHPLNQEETPVASLRTVTDLETRYAETRLAAPRLSSTCPMAPVEASEEIFAAGAVEAGDDPGRLVMTAENAVEKGTMIFVNAIATSVVATESATATETETGATAILPAGALPLDDPDHPTETFEIVIAMHHRS